MGELSNGVIIEKTSGSRLVCPVTGSQLGIHGLSFRAAVRRGMQTPGKVRSCGLMKF
jgi:hypothetical protein